MAIFRFVATVTYRYTDEVEADSHQDAREIVQGWWDIAMQSAFEDRTPVEQVEVDFEVVETTYVREEDS